MPLGRCKDGTDDDLFWMYFTVAEDGRKPAHGDPVDIKTGVNIENTQVDGNTGSNSGFPQVEGVGALGDGREGAGEGGVEAGVAGVGFGDSDCGRLAVVSNDEMRNHRMALLEPVPFKR